MVDVIFQVAQLYISWVNYTEITPKYQLVGFDSYMIDKSAIQRGTFNLMASQMAVWDKGKGFNVQPGMSSL